MTPLCHFLVLLLVQVAGIVAGSPWSAYNTTAGPVKDKLNIHVISHTHDDTGWLVTVDQYFYSEVRYILDTVTDALVKNPDRRFNYVEMAFFSRWWETQTEEKKRTVRKLVERKQLEFLNGGWCMHDEAGPLYKEMVDQTTRGHQFILKEFGPHAAPRATWQVDPFGHTNTQAWLLSAEAGMPALFWARMDRDDRDARRKAKELEYIWRGSRSLGKDAEVFGAELWGSNGDGLYNCPFDFETYKDIGVQDNPKRHDFNVKEWISKTLDAAKREANDFKTNHIFWACGFDFSHKNAATWYENLDALIHHVNLDGRVNMFYSTPASYADAINADRKYSWTIRKDDLMPLHEDPHVYWTGYYSSRVAFKRLARRSSNLLSIARQVELVTNVNPKPSTHQSPSVGTSWTDNFEGTVAVAMHHDGISGTAKQNVNNDYAQRITEAQEQVERGISAGLQQLAGGSQSSAWMYCRDLNISLCPLTTQTGGFSMIAWNPLGQPVKGFTFRLPVRIDQQQPMVLGDQNEISSQLLPLDHVTKNLPLLYHNSFGLDEQANRLKLLELTNNATHILVFQGDIPPVGYATFKVVFPDEEEETTPLTLSTFVDGDSFDNGVYRITLDPTTKAVTEITHLETDTTTDLELQWGWYESCPGGCSEFGCADLGSGAYLFRPNSSNFNFPGPEVALQTEIVQGPLVTEIRQTVSDWTSHVIRLEKDAPYVEIEYTAGPIPIENKWLKDPELAKQNIGKELVLRYKTGLASKKTFHTDSNGLEFVKRVRDERPASYPQTYSWHDEPISSNYYPVNAMISITDEESKKQFTVVTDSTQGGSSLHDGQLELMVLRRVFFDDDKGVVEPLNETMCGCNGADDQKCYCQGLAVRGVHRIVFGESETVNLKRRQVNNALQFRPGVFLSSDVDEKKLSTTFYSSVEKALPENVHLLTLNGNYAGKLLLRLQHLYEAGEHPTMSKPVSVCLKDLFKNFVSAKEMTLTGNLPVEQKFKYKWKYNNEEDKVAERKRIPYDEALDTVTLQAMEIRTFLVELEEDQVSSTF